MPRREERPPVGVVIALFIAAVALHGVALLGVRGAMELGTPTLPLPRTENFIEVDLEEAEAPEEERPDEDAQTLVHNDRIVDERPNERAKRISERDNRVEREQVAPNQRPVAGAAPTNPSKTGQQGRGQQPDPTERPSEHESEQPNDAKSVQPNAEAIGAHKGLVESERGDVVGGSAPPKLSGRSGIMGSKSALEQTFGRPGTFDRVEGVDRGNENVLETKQNKYASFFNRVRDAVADEWHPDAVHRANDPYGNIYGKANRHTRLYISLNPDGSLNRVRIQKRSGAEFLDEEAVRAVRIAAPFVNPPAQLIDESTGLIEFTFDFYLMLDGSMRIYRYKG